MSPDDDQIDVILPDHVEKSIPDRSLPDQGLTLDAPLACGADQLFHFLLCKFLGVLEPSRCHLRGQEVRKLLPDYVGNIKL